MTVRRTFCVAPMLDWTDRHARYLYRLLSRHTLLYTEMVTTGAIIHGDRDRHLGFAKEEQPVALQLGGSDPRDLVIAATVGEQYGYREINLNVGCPSDRVQSGRFGACLMAEPQLVSDCLSAMGAAVEIPVTVKTRLGIDHLDSYEFLQQFVETLADTGTTTFILHARTAWLKGLSPKQNREIPPLQYEKVYQVKREYPNLEIILNGGVKDLDAVESHLQRVDGVMLGREIFQNPMLLAEVDARLFGATGPMPDRADVLSQYLSYVDEQLARDVYLKHLLPPLFGLFQGQPGTRAWKRFLSENGYRKDAGRWVIEQAAREAFGELFLVA